jgi:hypothetical protein
MKAILGRLLGFEVLASQKSLLGSQGYHDAATRLSESLCWFTNEAIDDPDSTESLDSFLVSLVEKMKLEAAQLQPASRNAVSHILDELESRVLSFCASPNDPVGDLVGLGNTIQDGDLRFRSTARGGQAAT